MTTIAGGPTSNTMLPPASTTSVRFYTIDSVASDASGDVYVVHNRWGEYWKAELLKISGGMVSVVAESTGSSRFVSPAIAGTVVDPSGDVSMDDLQKVFHYADGYADGPFDQPPGLRIPQDFKVDADGNILVADQGNIRIRKIVFER